MRARLVVFAIGIAIIVATWQVWPSDQRRIRRLVDEMADVFDGRPTASDLERAARLAPLAQALSPDVVVEGFAVGAAADSAVLRGRESAIAAAMAALRFMPDLVVTVNRVDVSVMPGAPNATAVVGLTMVSRSADAAGRDIREVRLTLERQGKTWLVTHLAPEAALRP